MHAGSHDTLRARLVTLVGTPRAHPQDTCFYCGKSTVLGRVRGTLKGRLVTSCFRAECAEALKRVVTDSLKEESHA